MSEALNSLPEILKIWRREDGPRQLDIKGGLSRASSSSYAVMANGKASLLAQGSWAAISLREAILETNRANAALIDRYLKKSWSIVRFERQIDTA